MRHLKIALVAATALLGATFVSRSASAMPVGGLAAATNELSAAIQNVRWVCGPYRCWWQPNYAYGYWGPRFRYWGPRAYAYRWGHRRWDWR
jgi:hypothetical protein